MRVSYKWLQDYIDGSLGPPEDLVHALTMQAFEVEGVERAGDDTVFEIAVLPNRSHDCLSYVGIAREVATLFDLSLKLPAYTHKGDASIKTSDAVTLAPPDPRFVRRALKRLAVDVTVGESPEWLQERLIAQGQRPINNVVDATNFVMWETGQPVHAFDFDKIESVENPKSKIQNPKEIQIRPAKEGEIVETLDAKRYTLDPSVLVIADNEKALDIAGIKGGNDSGIDASTKRVLLSACTFHPTSIRKTSRKLNLLTDASKRFEQELSPVLAERGMARLSQLLAEIAGAKVATDIVEYYPHERHPYFIGVSVSEANALLGTELAADDIEPILTSLGFSWKKVLPRQEVLAEAEKTLGKPYKYGASVSYDAPDLFDCSSLVVYLFARAGIQVPRVTIDQYVFGKEMSVAQLEPGDLVFAHNSTESEEKEVELVATWEKIQQKVRHTKTADYMKGTEVPRGVGHVGIYLGGGKVLHASGLDHKGSVVVEPLSESPSFKNIQGYRRVIPSDEERYVVTVPPERLDLHAGPGFMVAGNSADLIEEIGRVYGYENVAPQAPASAPEPAVNKTFYYTNKIRDILVAEGFSEVYTYALTDEGEVELANPLAEDKKYLRAGLEKGLVGSLDLNIKSKPFLGLGEVKLFEIGTVFCDGEEYVEVGVAAEDEDEARRAMHIAIAAGLSVRSAPKGRTFPDRKGVLTANLTEYIETLGSPGSLEDLVPIRTEGRFVPLSVYPFVLRDIAVWVPKEVESHTVIKPIKEEGRELLMRVDQFDAFTKDEKTSYAYHLVLQSQEKTLSDDEINGVMARITETLNSRDGWEVR
ncbi:MAG TPA: phenylalanine--tRNA ligase beta subunit-related protein [Candidatus Paceibacterota bacterium]|nr:phenylalanine--tRNA ligase beta subunit-related protein [Candidatus Paceibacterota bacterium]